MSPLALGQGEKHLRAEVEPIEDDKSIPEIFVEKLPLRCKQFLCGSHPRLSALRRGRPRLLFLGGIHVTAGNERGSSDEDRSLCVFTLEESILALLGKIFEHFAALAVDEALYGTVFQLFESSVDVGLKIRLRVVTKPPNSYRLLRVVFFAFFF